ncbi:unnamed protein product [Caenorhabditis brenneri]
MQRFKLWKLPALARDNVIRQMVPADVIHLALVSKSFRQFLMRFKLHATLVCWFVTSTSMDISIEFDEDRKRKVDFQFGYSKGYYNPKTIKPIKESGFFFNFVAGETFFVMNPDGSPSSFLGIEKMSKLLLDILSVTKYEVDLDKPLINFADSDFFIWRTTRKFHAFTLITDDSMDTMENLNFLFEAIQTETLFTNIRIRNRHFEDPVEISHRSNFPLNMSNELHLLRCNWLSIGNLLEAKAKTIWVYYVTTVLPDDAIKILKSWMNGTKLKEMTDMRVGPFSSEEEVMEQVDTLNGVSRYNHPYATDDDRQMKRVTDGKVAVFHFFSEILTIRVS